MRLIEHYHTHCVCVSSIGETLNRRFPDSSSVDKSHGPSDSMVRCDPSVKKYQACGITCKWGFLIFSQFLSDNSTSAAVVSQAWPLMVGDAQEGTIQCPCGEDFQDASHAIETCTSTEDLRAGGRRRGRSRSRIRRQRSARAVGDCGRCRQARGPGGSKERHAQ